MYVNLISEYTWNLERFQIAEGKRDGVMNQPLPVRNIIDIRKWLYLPLLSLFLHAVYLHFVLGFIPVVFVIML